MATAINQDGCNCTKLRPSNDTAHQLTLEGPQREATLTQRTKAILLTLVITGWSFGATIGTITSNGRFDLEGATIWNQGTLLEGAHVATGSAASRLKLQNGADLRIGAASKARIYGNRLLLETGIAEGSLSESYLMEAAPMGITVTGKDAQAQVRVSEKGGVLVASLRGSLEIHGSQGLLLARLAEGNALELSPALQASGATAQMRLTGVVQQNGGTFTLTDEVTRVSVELRGQDVARFVGQRVTTTGQIAGAGTTPATGSQYVVNVVTMNQVGAGAAGAGAGAGATGAGAAGGAAAGAAAAAGLGIGTLTTVAVVGGVALAAGVAAVAAAGSDEVKAPVSSQPTGQ